MQLVDGQASSAVPGKAGSKSSWGTVSNTEMRGGLREEEHTHVLIPRHLGMPPSIWVQDGGGCSIITATPPLATVIVSRKAIPATRAIRHTTNTRHQTYQQHMSSERSSEALHHSGQITNLLGQGQGHTTPASCEARVVGNAEIIGSSEPMKA